MNCDFFKQIKELHKIKKELNFDFLIKYDLTKKNY